MMGMAALNRDALTQLADRIGTYRADPSLFVKQVIKAEPTPQQSKIIASVAQKKRTSVASGHGIGKSTTGAWLLWWFLCCFPHSRVPVTAPTGHQLNDVLWSEVVKWGNRMVPWFRDQFEVTADKVYHREGDNSKTWYAVARTARKENPDALQGFHGEHLLYIVDEASGVPVEVFQPVEGALTGEGNKILLQGNPTQTTGYLFDSHHRDRSRWNCFQMSSEDSPLVADDYVQSMEEKYGRESDIFRVRVLGQFPRASVNQLISLHLVEEAIGRDYGIDVYRDMPRLVGVDVARFGDDFSAIIRRQGLYSSELRRFHGLDTMTFAGIVSEEIREWNPHAVFIDGVGNGAGVVDRLRQLGYGIIEVNAGERAVAHNMYTNLRAEMWCKMRDWLQAGGKIPEDRQLIDDLTGPEYGFDAKNRIQLERKEDMKARGLASPDAGDALSLTFCSPVAPMEDRDDDWYDRRRPMGQSEVTGY